MGLLDGAFSTGDPTGDLGLIGGLLSMRMGQGGPAPLLMQAAAMKMQQQNQERLNRANDLQQLQGVYSILQNNEAMRWAQAKANGQPYSPSPEYLQIQDKIAKLSGLNTLSGSMASTPHQPSAAPMMPSVAPSQAQPPQAAQAVATPQAPQAQASQAQQAVAPRPSGFGAPAGGLDMADYMMAANNPGLKMYVENYAKSHMPQNVRPGGTVLDYDANGNPKPTFYAPKLEPGMQPTFGANGRQTSADLVPGYLQGLAAIGAAQSGAKAAGALPFQEPKSYNTPGAPTLMTPIQAITAATGQNPLSPQIPSDVQTQRNAQQLAILQGERARAQSPQDQQALDTQITALQRAQSSGKPFSYSSPGLTLQDQSSSAAQTEMGQGIGKEAAGVFTSGAASVQGKRMLAGMSDMAKSYTPDKFQGIKSTLAQYANAMGMDENTANRIIGTNTGDIQGLTSAAIAMAGKLTRQTDAQPSQLQFMKTLESMPMADRTGQGFARIMDYLNSMHDYNIDKMVALQQYLNSHKGDPSGFEAEWAQKARNMAFPWSNAPKGAQSGVDALVAKYRSR